MQATLRFSINSLSKLQTPSPPPYVPFRSTHTHIHTCLFRLSLHFSGWFSLLFTKWRYKKKVQLLSALLISDDNRIVSEFGGGLLRSASCQTIMRLRLLRGKQRALYYYLLPLLAGSRLLSPLLPPPFKNSTSSPLLLLSSVFSLHRGFAPMGIN